MTPYDGSSRTSDNIPLAELNAAHYLASTSSATLQMVEPASAEPGVVQTFPRTG